MVGGTKDLELIFNFRQVITAQIIFINSINLNGKRDKIINNLLNDVSDTISFWSVIDWWIKDDVSIL